MEYFSKNHCNYYTIIMNKKFLSIGMSICVLLVFAFHVNAASINSNDGLRIVTGYKDGSPDEITVYYAENDGTGLLNVNELYKPGYFPGGLNDEEMSSTLAATGTDNWVRVNASQDPYCTIGEIWSYWDTNNDGNPEYSIGGTASLQAPDILITCAHVFYNKSYGGWPTYIEFYPAQNSPDDREEVNGVPVIADWVEASIAQEYADSSVWLSQYDWAIIQIDQPLGNTYGWLGLHGCGQSEVGTSVRMSGYPEDKDGQQWRTSGTLSSVEENLIWHNLYSISGYSGSPIYDSTGSVYAIHVLGDVDNNRSGAGYRMTDELFGYIIDAYDASISRWP